jgi:hypothetical protein
MRLEEKGASQWWTVSAAMIEGHPGMVRTTVEISHGALG